MWNPPLHSENTDGKKGAVLLSVPGRRREHSGRRGDGPRNGDHVCGVGQVMRGLRARSGHRQGRGAYRSIGPDCGGLEPLPGAGWFSRTRRSPDVQTSVRAHHRHRHEHRRAPLVDTPTEIHRSGSGIIPACKDSICPTRGSRPTRRRSSHEAFSCMERGRGGEPRFHAVDKRTGERVGTVELPAPTDTAPMTFIHEGRQYVVMAVSGRNLPGSLVALRLP